ncbi:MAG TPA: hypothetical protein VGV15_09245, partial [Terriglobales bacterium]|nr:hypothetical protein [Terriglobales bacterium]
KMGLLLRIGDRNVRNYREFTMQLHYLHRNPVKRGLVLKRLLGSSSVPSPTPGRYALRRVDCSTKSAPIGNLSIALEFPEK